MERALADPVGLDTARRLAGEVDAHAAAASAEALAVNGYQRPIPKEPAPPRTHQSAQQPTADPQVRPDIGGTNRDVAAGTQDQSTGRNATDGGQRQPQASSHQPKASEHPESAQPQTRNDTSTKSTPPAAERAIPQEASTGKPAPSQQTNSSSLIARLERGALMKQPERTLATKPPPQPQSNAKFTIEQEAVLQQTTRGMAQILKNDGGSLTLRLTPEALGEIRVKIDLHQGVASARFDTTNPEAARALEAGLPQLKAALESRGVRVDQIEIQHHEQPGTAVKPDSSGDDGQRRHDRQRPLDSGPAFANGQDAASDSENRDASGGTRDQSDHAAAGAPQHSVQDPSIQADDAAEDPQEPGSEGGMPTNPRGANQLRLDAVA